MSRPLVLCYHTLSDDLQLRGAVRPHEFRRQMRMLADNGYRSVTFSQAVLEPATGPAVCVTFDDGFLATYERALPVMTEVGFVGTAFVPTGHITTGTRLAWAGYDAVPQEFSTEMAPMFWSQVRALLEAGWEVGSHTIEHPHLTEVSDRVLDEELRASREACEQSLQRACTSLAYPYGDVDRRVRDATERAGYLCAAALGPQRQWNDPLWWPRLGVYRDDRTPAVRIKTSRAAHSRAGLAAVSLLRSGLAAAHRRLPGSHEVNSSAVG